MEGIADSGLLEPVYNCAVENFHTYFVGSAAWQWSVWAHNASCDARKLGKDLNAAGEVRGVGEQAAHIVPIGAFSGRKTIVQKAIQKAKEALEWAGIDINSAANGFFASVGHNGTHTNVFFLKLGKLMENAMRDGNVAKVLADIKAVAGKIP